MKYRTLGRTGLTCSEVSLGTWAFASGVYGDVAPAESLATIRTALDLGVTVFDTAPLYGTADEDGTAESVLGEGLGRHRDEVVVMSKFGRLSTRGPAAFTAATARTSVEGSLRRLGTDRLDVLFFHSPAGAQEIDDDIWSALDDLKNAGKVRFVGHSVSWFAETSSMARSWAQDRQIDVVQVALNLLHREPERLVEDLGEAGIGIVVREALANGFLSGAVNRDTAFPDGHVNARYGPAELADRLDQVDRLSFLVREDIQCLATAALRWVLDHPGVSTVLTGATTPSQLAEGCFASDVPGYQPEELDLARYLHERDWAVA